MSRLRASLVWFAAIGGLLTGLALWRNAESRRPADFIGFTAAGYASPIFIDRADGDGARRAAEMLQQTLGQSAGRSPAAFPIKVGDWKHRRERGIYLLVEPAAWARRDSSAIERLEYPARYESSSGRLRITSRTPEALAAAASWFLEKELGAHWFIPGSLGTEVPRRSSFRLGPIAAESSPSFVSRNFSAGGAPEERVWYARNRLNSLFDHGHSMGRIFKREDLLATPELAPLISGKRFRPREGDTNSWQPNLASPLAAPYAAGVLKQWLRETPGKLSVPLCMNDSVGYDQSAETLRLVGDRGFFRDVPDYSNLVFGFVNQVAREVAREFPDRYVTAYAYHMTENTPDFPLEANVVPFLTADRVQWFDPEFAAGDRALIKRWTKAGPRVVGLYDYLYGSTFQVPRPAIYAVTESIPFASAAGVRAYYAESSPNWGLDGPKGWLVAQLLWDARQDPDKLLETYYREFWQEAAGPMRKFDALCDAQWRTQPLPSYWLKYFKDEHQHLLFPAATRQTLHAQLDLARRVAKTPVVRNRLRLVSEAFAVTETFGEFCERRDALIRLLLAPQTGADELLAATKAYLEAHRRFTEQSTKTRKEFPLAVLPIPPELMRNAPLGSALYRLSQISGASQFSATLAALRRDFPLVALLAPAALPLTSRLISIDPQLKQVRVAMPSSLTATDWTTAGPWRGYGLHEAHRRATLVATDRGNAIRLVGCREENFWQWLPAEGTALYRATVRVKGKVSPGNMTFLAVYFTDAGDKQTDLGTIQRLPVGEWKDEVELSVVVRAPKHAPRVGVAVRAVNQVGGDFVEFSRVELSLLR